MTAPAGSEDAGLVLSAEERTQYEVAEALDDLVMSKGVTLDDGRLDWLTDWIAARVEAARAEERERIAAAIWAAKHRHLARFRDWTPAHQAYDDAACIARTPPPAGTSQPLRATNDDRENA